MQISSPGPAGLDPASDPDPAFWAGRPVLVTGHTGFKGAWLGLWLKRLGARVSGLALAPDTEPSLFGLALDGTVSSRIADIRDAAAVRDRLSETEPDIVFHLAAQALVGTGYRDPLGTYATNVMGTAHLLEAVRATPSVRAVVVVTSDKAYENREWPYGYRETDPLGGRDPYGSSKACAELVAGAYRASFFAPKSGRECRIATARAGNVIGGGDWSAGRLIPDLVRAFARGASAAIRAPHAIRPWQHVLEPLGGYLRLAERLRGVGGERYAEAWNFGPADEDCRPVSYVADALARAWGDGAAWHLSDAAHPHEATFLKVDASKARAALGWDRRLRLHDALAWTATWHRALAAGGSARDLTLAQIAAYERGGSDP